MKHHLLLWPRLDIPFKNLGPVSNTRLPLSPIRQHWHNFLEGFSYRLKESGDNVTVIEKPLFEFTKDYVLSLVDKYDTIYIPHKQKIDFDVGETAQYYAQTVFPDYFTVDKNGWGAALSWIDEIDLDSPITDAERSIFEKLKARAERNESKFTQPVSTIGSKDYFLFICQIPHDETFKYFSRITGPDALRASINIARKYGKELIVKGHPVNPGSMAPYIKICQEEKIQYLDNASIHNTLAHAQAVFLVNSGVGFEAMLHGKSIYRFANSEYRNVVPWADQFRMGDTISINRYVKFIAGFIKNCHNEKG